MKELSEDEQAVGLRLRRARKSRGLSLSDVAQAALVSHQQMQKYEVGVDRLTIGRLIEIARILKIDPRDLLVEAQPRTAQAAHRQPNVSKEGLDVAKAYDRLPPSAAKRALFKLVMSLEAEIGEAESTS